MLALYGTQKWCTALRGEHRLKIVSGMILRINLDTRGIKIRNVSFSYYSEVN
jgi:hypothetical protein